eukprot:6979805-Pyramimonas_sp.AAC.1
MGMVREQWICIDFVTRPLGSAPKAAPPDPSAAVSLGGGGGPPRSRGELGGSSCRRSGVRSPARSAG